MKKIPAWKLAMYARDAAADKARAVQLAAMTPEARAEEERRTSGEFRTRDAARRAETLAAFASEEGK